MCLKSKVAETDLPPIGSLPKWPQWLQFGQERGIPFHVGDRGPSTWAIFCCFPRSIMGELDQDMN